MPIFPGLMAVGEAGCASVHGANRLGSNSLIDLVVFGRAAAIRAGRSWTRRPRLPPVNKAEVDRALSRFDTVRHAAGAVPTAELRLEMQRTMQADAAVFRTEETLAEGETKMTAIAGKMADLQVTDRSPGLEQRPDGDAGTGQPDAERAGHDLWRPCPDGKPRRPCA